LSEAPAAAKQPRPPCGAPPRLRAGCKRPLALRYAGAGACASGAYASRRAGGAGWCRRRLAPARAGERAGRVAPARAGGGVGWSRAGACAAKQAAAHRRAAEGEGDSGPMVMIGFFIFIYLGLLGGLLLSRLFQRPDGASRVEFRIRVKPEVFRVSEPENPQA